MSSLDRVELLSTLEHRYNVELNETQFAKTSSPPPTLNASSRSRPPAAPTCLHQLAATSSFG